MTVYCHYLLSLQCRRIFGAEALNNPSQEPMTRLLSFVAVILGEEAREGWGESKVTLGRG